TRRAGNRAVSWGNVLRPAGGLHRRPIPPLAPARRLIKYGAPFRLDIAENERIMPARDREEKLGKLIVWNIASVDGYFEGAEPWDLAHHETVWGDQLQALSISQLEDAEALIFGRRTYEGFAAYWPNETETGAITDH